MMGEMELVREEKEKIFVSVRLRPLSRREISSNDVSDWECINNDTIVYKHAHNKSMHPSAFTFDRVFGSDCSMRMVYEHGAKKVAISVVHGVNSTIFAYGQTSSGKTYTMTGITEYAITDIYDYIEKHPEREFTLKLSAMEIHNECVRDLLSEDSTPLRVVDDPERGIVVENLTEEILKDRDHVTELLFICEAQRQTEETWLNETSSLSHQIIRLTVESSFPGVNATHAATLNLVDLAGSEGSRMDPSLLSIIRNLRNYKDQNGDIPRKDSKLTQILETSLRRNTRTALLCTMSPARSHVEQSRSTLRFAKEVAINAHVGNVGMSDKSLVKDLQDEITRLESELRSRQHKFTSLNYSTLLKEKDAQIEKLEKEVKDLIMQRDVSQSHVQVLSRKLGDDTSSVSQVGSRNYPHLRVHESPDCYAKEPESCALADPEQDELNHKANMPYFDDQRNEASPSILLPSGSNISETDSFYGLQEIEKLIRGDLDDLCRQVGRMEEEISRNTETPEPNHSYSEDGTQFPVIKVHVNGEGNGNISSSQELTTTSVKQETEESPNRNSDSFGSRQYNESTSATPYRAQDSFGSSQYPESTSATPYRPLDSYGSRQYPGNTSFASYRPQDSFGSRQYLESTSATPYQLQDSFGSRQYLESTSVTPYRPQDSFGSRQYLESTSATPYQPQDSFGSRQYLNNSSLTPYRALDSFTSIRRFNLAANMVADSPPWFKMANYGENTPYNVPEKESVASPLNFGSSMERFSGKVGQSRFEKSLDIGIENFSTSQDSTTCTPDIRDDGPKLAKYPMKNVKFDELEQKEEENRLTSWPVEFRKLRKEMIELWQACNTSLVHRSYFFLMFQGDPSDAIYLEVEIRRNKVLKDKFARGDKIIIDGRRLTLSSSAKALRQERKILTEQMIKKLTEEERKKLFMEWGIGFNTKQRRQQLANLIWSKTDDVNHVTESAFLVAKLTGFMELEQTPSREMFGASFTPKSLTRGHIQAQPRPWFSPMMFLRKG